MKIFSDRLKQLITESNLTQKEFAEIHHFGRNQINFWCNGKAEPDFKTLVYICGVFEVSSDFLLGIKDY